VAAHYDFLVGSGIPEPIIVREIPVTGLDDNSHTNRAGLYPENIDCFLLINIGTHIIYTVIARIPPTAGHEAISRAQIKIFIANPLYTKYIKNQ
jgi:hypothetical protein